MESDSQSSFGTPVIQRPIIFMNEIDPTDSDLKRELQNWKPRQRQTPILEIQHSSFERSQQHVSSQYRQEQSRQDYSKEERENFTSFIPGSVNITPSRKLNSPAKSRPTIHDSPVVILDTPVKNRPIIHDTSNNSPVKILESPANFHKNVHSNITPTRKSTSPTNFKHFNNSPIWKPNSPLNNQPVIRDPYNSPRIQQSPTNVLATDFVSLESSAASDSNSADKTLTPQDFDELPIKDTEHDKFERVFKQLNKGIADLRHSLTRNPTKHLSDSRLHDQQKYSSDRSLSTSSDSRVVQQPRPTQERYLIGRAQSYSINTELHAIFDFPASSSKNDVEVCKTLARSFIDRTKEVYKLKVAIRHREVSDASSVGNKEMVKRLRAEELDLVNEFNEWKKSTKNHYKQLLTLQKGTQSLQQVISDLQQKIRHAQKESNRLCNVLEGSEKLPMHNVQSADKVVQTTGRLTQNQGSFLPSASKKQDALVQRSVQTYISQQFIESPQQRYNVEPVVETEPSKQAASHNSSIVSLVEDDNILEAPELPVIASIEPSPSRVPPLNFMPLITPVQLEEPNLLPVSDRAIESERSSSTAANTENDVSSIAFDEIAHAAHPPIVEKFSLEREIEPVEKEQASLNTSSRTIDEKLANIDEVEVQNEEMESDPRTSPQQIINESVVEIEETKVDFRPLESTALETDILPDTVLHPLELFDAGDLPAQRNLIESEEVSEIIVEQMSDIEEIHVEQMTSDSVASELPSSAFDDSLANLDEPVQDSLHSSKDSHSSQESKSTVSKTASSPKRDAPKSSSSSSLKSPPTASDKSILRVKSFQISSEIPSSSGSKQSGNNSSDVLSTTF